jgi:hypothetical protein
VDADHAHGLVTMRSITGSRLTYGLELVASRVAFERVVEVRLSH